MGLAFMGTRSIVLTIIHVHFWKQGTLGQVFFWNNNYDVFIKCEKYIQHDYSYVLMLALALNGEDSNAPINVHHQWVIPGDSDKDDTNHTWDPHISELWLHLLVYV